MAANRRNNSTAIRLVPALKALFLCLLIGGSGVGYVWQKNQIHELGQQIKKREIVLEELRRLNKQRRDKLDELRSPPMLDARVKQLNLGLALPQQAQLVRLPEPVPNELAGKAVGSSPERLYAEHGYARPASPR
jgi:hypothetical protein